MRPRLIDLFCAGGGCSMGYHRAGFDVVGVDIVPQPHYPFEFHQADALTFPLDGFDAVHASPPCHAHSTLRGMHPEREWPDLIPQTRELLARFAGPWVIENVPGAPLASASDLFGAHGVMLCGTSFGLGARGMELRRHRLFESNVPLAGLPCRHRLKTIGVYGHGGHTGKHRMAYAAEAREALGIDWLPRDSMSLAIPPAYTEHIGRQLMAHLEANAA